MDGRKEAAYAGRLDGRTGRRVPKVPSADRLSKRDAWPSNAPNDRQLRLSGVLEGRSDQQERARGKRTL